MLRKHGILTSDGLVTDLLSDFVLRHGQGRVMMCVNCVGLSNARGNETAESQHLRSSKVVFCSDIDWEKQNNFDGSGRGQEEFVAPIYVRGGHLT